MKCFKLNTDIILNDLIQILFYIYIFYIFTVIKMLYFYNCF